MRDEPLQRHSVVEWPRPPLFRDLASVGENRGFRAADYPLPQRTKDTRYPIRLIRYWLQYHFLRELYLKKGTPLHVCEVGVDRGQFLRFVRSVPAVADSRTPACAWARWTAVDIDLQEAPLRLAGYSDLIEADIEHDLSWVSEDDDVLVLSHVLEHLRRPEDVFAGIARRMRRGTVVIGGLPHVPHFVIPVSEPMLRAAPRPGGHLSEFSLRRFMAMVEESGLRPVYLTGGYLLRWDGARLENSALWFRFNVLFGRTFRRFPSELYWLLEKS